MKITSSTSDRLDCVFQSQTLASKMAKGNADLKKMFRYKEQVLADENHQLTGGVQVGPDPSRQVAAMKA